MRTNGSHLSGSASSGKIASTGHSGSQAPQSMHSSGSMTRIRSAVWMQSTGQTSTQERSLMSIQGSAMMYVTALTVDSCPERALREPSVFRRSCELRHEILEPLGERRFREYLVEACGVRGAETGRVGVIREADDRDVGIRVRDLLRIDARHVRDDEVGTLRVIDCDETMSRQERLELPPHEQIDPTEQDRGHVGRLKRSGDSVQEGARRDSSPALLRSARGARGGVARGAARGAGFLPGARARRR